MREGDRPVFGLRALCASERYAVATAELGEIESLVDIPGDASTGATISIGATLVNEIETSGDHDWIAVTLTGGEPVVITINGITLSDPYLVIRDSSGFPLFQNDDISTGVNLNSRVAFRPGYSGTYFIDVSASNGTETGAYQISVSPYVPPSPGTVDQIANQLTTGFWDGGTHHFDVAQGGTITVNISSLNPAEQALARAALAEWTDIIGVHFSEVSSGGQIVFDDREGPDGSIAATDAVWSNGITTSAHVQISSSWVDTYGSGLDSYSFQTYVHEIGHALGLGHPGDYNGDARYPYDALFSNDAWPLSVMSYFDTTDNTSYSYRANFVLTPMAADIIAMQSLYGLSTVTRTGDTIYGFHSNAGGIYDASAYPNASYTIFDSGGTDTLDFSGSQYDQQINLNPETFSSFNGHNLDIYIARGVVIENAIGGSASDTIIQNSANNVLDGGAGDDTLSYETATAGVTIDLRITTRQDTGGAGLDTIRGFEHLIGTAYSDVLIGGAATVSLDGGAGNDLLDAGGAGQLAMYGGDGDDVFILRGTAATWIDGGSGFNVVDCSAETAGVTLITDGHAGAGIDTLGHIQEIIGSNYADTLYAWNVGDTLLGGAGNDSLTSSRGLANLAGGTGDDRYEVWTSTDHITENAGEGIDTVVARANFTLGANLENLILYETGSSDPYAGFSVPPPGGYPEDWNGTGNDLANVITGNAGANVLSGLGGNDVLTGGAGADTLTGGAGDDYFKDTGAGLNSDIITDFSDGDKIIITDANIRSFTFSLSGHTLTYTGGSLTLTNVPTGAIYASAAPGGGVQLTLTPSPTGPTPENIPHNDLNGDGLSDLIWRNDSGQLNIWSSTGSNFITTFSSSIAGNDWHVAGTGDFNGDGLKDIIWRNNSGQVNIWDATSEGGFVTGYSSNIAGNAWHIVGTGDFNGDGRSDIAWRNDNGQFNIWQSTGGDSFVTSFASSALSPAWHVAAAGDFNGDGLTELVLRNDSGQMSIWQSIPGMGFGISFSSSIAGNQWHVIGTGDFNGDGLDDIVWRNDSGQVNIWQATAGGSFVTSYESSIAGNDWHVATIGDFNGDGRSDIAWRNDNGQLNIWQATSDNSFITSYSTVVGNQWHIQDPFL